VHQHFASCQLLDKSRAFKYQQANLETLSEAIQQCRPKTVARVQLYRWLLFNVIVGNGDNHLKNISFRVSSAGIELAPFYDLLSTAAYATPSYAHQNATWPRVEMAVSIEGVHHFNDITRDKLLQAGETLGLAPASAARELSTMERDLPKKADKLFDEITQTSETLIQDSPSPDAVRQVQGGELMLLRAIRKIVIHDMLERIQQH